MAGSPLPSFSFGGGASSSTTNASGTQTTNGTFDKTTTPIMPDWAARPVQTAAGRVEDLFNLNPYDLVAPANGLQNRAAQEAGWLNDSGWTFNAANGIMANAAGPGASTYQADTYGGAAVAPTREVQADSLLTNLNAYTSPYRQQVVDSALSDFDHAAGLHAADARNTAGQFNANQAETAFRRQMDAARGMTDVATAYGQNQRANIATQAQVGDMMRNIDNEQRQAPLKSAQQLIAMLNGIPISLFQGQREEGQNAQVETSTSTSKTRGKSVQAGVTFGGS